MINNNLLIKTGFFAALFTLFSTLGHAEKIHFITKQAVRSASQDSIKGLVLDQNGKPLSGVHILVKGGTSATISKIDGKFNLGVLASPVLIFQHPDFYDLETSWKGQKNWIVQLANRYLSPIGSTNIDPRDSGLIEEVSVDILHGRQLKSNLLQSIATVNTNQLTTTPAAQFLQALPGRLAGLNIGFTNGAPGLDGNGLNYNIRSARTTNPIILIDGVQRGFLSIDPDEIESVSVLKDALATVMYGMRSSNGIISITTKKGNRGAPRISFTAQSGIERPTALPQPLSAGQYATLFNEAQQNDAGTTTITPRYSVADIAAYNNGTDPYGHPNVDWYNTVLNDRSAINRYNFNVQGSGNRFRYFVDVDNLKETGLFKTIDDNTYNTNAQLDRYLVRTNVGVDVTNTTFMQLNLFGRIQRNNQAGATTNTIFSQLVTTPANAYPVFNPDGSLAGNSTYGQNVNIYGQSVQRGYQFQDARDMAIDLNLTQKLDVLLPGLYAKLQGSYNNSTLYTTTLLKDFAAFQYNANGTYTKFGTTSAQTAVGTPNDRTRITYVEGDLGYDQTFGKHHVSALFLADQQSSMPFLSGNLPEKYTDIAGRITYNWDNKYLIEGSGSYAGYNYFAPARRWAPFWAGGIGWNAHNESFIKNNVSWISNLKLRATYGLTGQANPGYYTYIQTYYTNGSSISGADAFYFGNVALQRGSGQLALVNPDLRPEKAKKANAAIDLGLFGNKLSLTVEYFKNRFYDLLLAPGTQSVILGTNYPTKNLGIYDYWGSDISLTWQSKVKNFNYFFTGNFSIVQSKVIFNDETPKVYDYQKTTGKQVGLLYGYTATGLFQSYDEINDPKTAVLASTPKSSLRPGDIRYLDRNGDGLIDNNDNGAIGSGKPTVYFGATIGFSYKGFDMSALFQGTANRQLALGGPTGQNGDFFNGFGNSGLNNAYQYNLGRWTPQTAATATQPRLWVGSNVNNQQVSTYWLRNADFIRLKNAEIGYTLPATLTRKIGVPSIRVFTNGLNLVTWSELFNIRKDIDPETLGATYPIMRVINFGITAKF